VSFMISPMKGINRPTFSVSQSPCRRSYHPFHSKKQGMGLAPGPRHSGTFAAAAPRLWNSLPSDIRQPDLSYGQFRRSLMMISFWAVGPRRSATCVNCALEALLLTYLLLGMSSPGPTTTYKRLPGAKKHQRHLQRPFTGRVLCQPMD